MTALTPLSAPANLLKPPPTAAIVAPMSASEHAKRAAIKKTAQDFEASFLTSSLGSMFKGVTVSAPFGGGEGEEAFKSFLYEAMAKQMVKAGGIGIAAQVQKEMLKMQGLSPEPTR